MTWQEHAIVAGCRWGLRPLLALPIPWRVHRRLFGLARPSATRMAGVTVAQETVAGIPGRTFTPSGGARGTLLWLHGGGFVLGSSGGAYAAFGAALARRTGRRVVMPDYRLAPEWPFPAAPEDVLAVARAMRAEGPFALGGDSAGGTLALGVLAALLVDETAPERVILISPAVDLDASRPVPEGRRELVLPLAMLRRVFRAYAGTTDPRDPCLSPIHGCYEGAPPVLIEAAWGEMLEGDADAIHARLQASGVDATIRKESGVPHVWQLIPAFAATERSMAAIVAFLAEGPR